MSPEQEIREYIDTFREELDQVTPAPWSMVKHANGLDTLLAHGDRFIANVYGDSAESHRNAGLIMDVRNQLPRLLRNLARMVDRSEVQRQAMAELDREVVFLRRHANGMHLENYNALARMERERNQAEAVTRLAETGLAAIRTQLMNTELPEADRINRALEFIAAMSAHLDIAR